MKCTKKRHFLRHLYLKTNILPRQARDKRRETQQQEQHCLSRSLPQPFREGHRERRRQGLGVVARLPRPPVPHGWNPRAGRLGDPGE
jgi:hypothetical protein